MKSQYLDIIYYFLFPVAAVQYSEEEWRQIREWQPRIVTGEEDAKNHPSFLQRKVEELEKMITKLTNR